jgi:HAD superfamily hydrolase (TIGR01549 family)
VAEPSGASPVVLFDWGETLVWIPGMIHDPDRHLDCVASIFDTHIRASLQSVDPRPDCAAFVDCYLEACRRQIDQSRRTLEEHGFADRFAMSFELAGARSLPEPEVLQAMADALGEAITEQALLLEHTAEVVPLLARSYRLGLVSNYPHAAVVHATLARFDLLAHFETVVVSSETGWMKPHPGCYRPALDALRADPTRTLMVGDDLRNDVQGARTLGLHAAWLAPGKAPHADAPLQIQTLAELPALCERLFA